MPKWILIVEDDSAILEVLETMLSEKYRVMKATNGKEAVKIYRMLKPDLVLMDIMMPVMDGIEATKEIKSKYPNAKILGVTAFASQKGKEILEAGALEIIEKPFTKKKLLETIEKYLKD
ncbi:MAG: two-component system, chemotaxis family, chemotaxis protein CheY [Archaeoglobaceae archaeon]|nr:two-component system, chemotaxis family, chemotaxis protein CheY [Archaeoglobaceae archaeon]MDK2876298.1 two-component system, chemotaxis family, chemotaxis protein CheY [Archaeoglobaceae archaeon]